MPQARSGSTRGPRGISLARSAHRGSWSLRSPATQKSSPGRQGKMNMRGWPTRRSVCIPGACAVCSRPQIRARYGHCGSPFWPKALRNRWTQAYKFGFAHRERERAGAAVFETRLLCACALGATSHRAQERREDGRPYSSTVLENVLRMDPGGAARVIGNFVL